MTQPNGAPRRAVIVAVAVLGIGNLATALGGTAVARVVRHQDQARIDAPASEVAVRLDRLIASVDGTMATARGVLMTDPSRLAPALRASLTGASTVRAVALASTGRAPRLLTQVGVVRLWGLVGGELPATATAHLAAWRAVTGSYRFAFTAVAPQPGTSLYVEIEIPAPTGAPRFALSSTKTATSQHVVLEDGGSSGLVAARHPVEFGGRSFTLFVEPDVAPPRLLGLSLPALVVLLGAIVTLTAAFAGADVTMRNRRVRRLDRALAQQRAAEAELRATKDRLVTIVQGTPDAIGFVDAAAATIEIVNRADFFGHDLDTLRSSGGFAALLASSNSAEAGAQFWARLDGLADDDVAEGACRICQPDGEIRMVRTRCARLAGIDTKHSSYVAVFTDVTEELRQGEREAELRDALFRSQRLESVAQLAGGIAHDFNNILAVVMGCSELLAADASVTSERGTEYVHEIHSAAIRGAALVRQLLTFARCDVTAVAPVDLNATIQGLESLLRRTLGDAVQLQLVLDERACTVEADPSRIEQVVLNLAINSRDAMPDGGVLWIATSLNAEEDPPTAVLSVTDTGCGIDESVRDTLFEPFVSTKPADRGTGLGLATVHGIVTSLHGRITMTSTRGEGTSFEVSLPAAAAVPAELPHEATTAAPTFGGRILVVDDDPAVRVSVADMCRRAGFEAMVAANAPEALQTLAGEHFDVLLTDAAMPGMSGAALAAEVAERHRDIALVIMSGYVRSGTTDALGVEHLQKPFGAAELSSAIVRARQANSQIEEVV